MGTNFRKVRFMGQIFLYNKGNDSETEGLGMQTIYYSTRNFLSQQDKIVDLEAYRRRCQGLADREEESFDEPEPLSPAEPALPQADRRAWLLDFWASLGIVVMTVTFTLRVLFP
jgi:hypothetical protein